MAKTKAKESVTVKIPKLKKSQLDLLRELSDDEQGGFDEWACDHTKEEDDNMYFLCQHGLASSILGEQFYITDLGKQCLKNNKA